MPAEDFIPGITNQPAQTSKLDKAFDIFGKITNAYSQIQAIRNRGASSTGTSFPSDTRRQIPGTIILNPNVRANDATRPIILAPSGAGNPMNMKNLLLFGGVAVVGVFLVAMSRR